MPFVQATQTDKLYPPATLPGIADGDWIEISTVNTSALRRKTMQRAMGISMKASDPGNPDMSFDVFGYRQALLEEIVIGWSDSEPVTADAIAGLHPEVQDWISEQYDQRTAGRSEEEKKASNGNSPRSTRPKELASATPKS